MSSGHLFSVHLDIYLYIYVEVYIASKPTNHEISENSELGFVILVSFMLFQTIVREIWTFILRNNNTIWIHNLHREGIFVMISSKCRIDASAIVFLLHHVVYSKKGWVQLEVGL